MQEGGSFWTMYVPLLKLIDPASMPPFCPQFLLSVGRDKRPVVSQAQVDGQTCVAFQESWK